MNKPLWAVAGAALLGVAGVTSTLVIASRGDEEELLQQPATATATTTASPSPSPSPTPGPEASPTPSPAPPNSPTPIAVTPAPPPEGWVTHIDAVHGFSFAYPANWSIQPDDGTRGSTRVASFDLAGWNGDYPPGSMLVDLLRVALEQGALDNYPDGPPEDATAAVLDGISGWQRVWTDTDPSDGAPPYEQIHSFAVDRNGYRYSISAAFADASPDKTTLVQIVESFRFID